MVTGVGFLIHVYSVGYMSHEKAFARYFVYLNLFTFAMLLLVLGSNFLLMFVGWEGVGLCSYLLRITSYNVCYTKLLRGRTICALADAAVMPAQSFVWKFREEFDRHIIGRKCPYGNRF